MRYVVWIKVSLQKTYYTAVKENAENKKSARLLACSTLLTLVGGKDIIFVMQPVHPSSKIENDGWHWQEDVCICGFVAEMLK
jgi:hypothetical protein